MLKDIPELLQHGVISKETADSIERYYKAKGGQPRNWLFIIFGILGAILVGLGIILILAHNWDELSRATKTIFAFLPLLLGQVVCGFVLLKKQESMAWREGSAAFLFFAVGASIALVSQIYNIPGNLSAFILWWMLLCLPLVNVMKSSIVSLFYLVGITYYACEVGYWSRRAAEPYLYWLLLLLVLPHYYFLFKKNAKSNFAIFHNWLIPLSVVIVLGTISSRADEFLFIAYMSLFGLFYLIGSTDFFAKEKLRNNGYKVIGALGTIVILLGLSFDWFWEDLRSGTFQWNEIVVTPEFLVAILISVLATVFLYLHIKDKRLADIKPIAPVFLVFIVTFFLGFFSPIAAVLINLYVFIIGVLTIREGAKQNHLGIVNYGLMIITALVICRFLDTDLSFVLRGLLFIAVGAGFFATNYWMIKKRRTNE